MKSARLTAPAEVGSIRRLFFIGNRGRLELLERAEEFMRLALEEARAASDQGEIPVGAVAVKDGLVIGAGHNRREGAQDPTAHAELLAIQAAAKAVGAWRLSGVTVYVTLEPCAMCAGALVLARVDRVVFGTRDPKAGAVGSLMNLAQDPRLNHRMEVVEGVLAEECGATLKAFFKRLRRPGAG
ncbi:MAG: tRNA adenosine(34) deaminase TadA [Deltaproteobacteria bacterium]|nr:tRNA adenosine(34) deaminase TadA [Deltaproteobacteria bacterium]